MYTEQNTSSIHHPLLRLSQWAVGVPCFLRRRFCSITSSNCRSAKDAINIAANIFPMEFYSNFHKAHNLLDVNSVGCLRKEFEKKNTEMHVSQELEGTQDFWTPSKKQTDYSMEDLLHAFWCVLLSSSRQKVLVHKMFSDDSNISSTEIPSWITLPGTDSIDSKMESHQSLGFFFHFFSIRCERNMYIWIPI